MPFNICTLLANYFRNPLNCESPKDQLTFASQNQIQIQNPPTLEIVTQVIQELKNNTAPGEDVIPTEMWKIGGERLTKKINTNLIDFWFKETIPKDWQSTHDIRKEIKLKLTIQRDLFAGCHLINSCQKSYSKN